MKRWYAIQTYAGSELKVVELLEERVKAEGLDRKVEKFQLGGQELRFLAPVEEVITSKSRRGRTGEYRVPYDYELQVESNKRISKEDVLAVKSQRYMSFDGKVKSMETLQRVIIEMTNRNEEEYLIPVDKRIRRDIKTGEKILSGVPLTTDKDPRFISAVKGKIVQRDRVKRIEFIKLEKKEDKEKEEKTEKLEKTEPETVTLVIPERYLARIKDGMRLKKGDLLEKEDKIETKASGMVKIKEYKDKRVVTIQRIEKRRLFPGYVFAKLDMGQDIVNMTQGIKCRFVGNPPLPLSEEDMKVVKRKAGLLEMPKAARPKIEVEFEVGEVVEIIDGPFADFTGDIIEMDKDKEEVTVRVKIFGRETPVKLSFDAIEKI
ncbi:KOW motif-containing protein [Candidatus Acetothermia bacterium]|nr:KOW motif-containing protein [Candidatus Acetothermia bacterium]MBI3659662.1 KOW motif-containing protein [Candidatus Acetothermia bacterium]